MIGRTRVLTPVADIYPIIINNSTINKLTLHNYDFMINNNLNINSEIGVVLSGDIIPKLSNVYNFQSKYDLKNIKCSHCGEIGTVKRKKWPFVQTKDARDLRYHSYPTYVPNMFSI